MSGKGRGVLEAGTPGIANSRKQAQLQQQRLQLADPNVVLGGETEARAWESRPCGKTNTVCFVQGAMYVKKFGSKCFAPKSRRSAAAQSHNFKIFIPCH